MPVHTYYNVREINILPGIALPATSGGNGGIMMEQLYHFSAPGRTEISGNHTDHQHGLSLIHI